MPEAQNFDAAWRFAIELGYAPNLFVSINWAEAPSDLDAVERLTRFKDALKAFMQRHAPGVPPIWLEVREKPRKGENVHLALYVPDELRERFTAAARRWVERPAVDATPAAVDVRPVGPRWWDRRDYMLKGGDEAVQKQFDTARFKKGGQGTIEGPRIRVSHAIGPSARKAAKAAEKAREALRENVMALVASAVRREASAAA